MKEYQKLGLLFFTTTLTGPTKTHGFLRLCHQDLPSHLKNFFYGVTTEPSRIPSGPVPTYIHRHLHSFRSTTSVIHAHRDSSPTDGTKTGPNSPPNGPAVWVVSPLVSTHGVVVLTSSWGPTRRRTVRSQVLLPSYP